MACAKRAPGVRSAGACARCSMIVLTAACEAACPWAWPPMPSHTRPRCPKRVRAARPESSFTCFVGSLPGSLTQASSTSGSETLGMALVVVVPRLGERSGLQPRAELHGAEADQRAILDGG